MRMHISLTLRLMALPLLVAIGGASLAEDWHFSADAGVVAISDVHGDYDAMQETLRRAGIVDEKLQWSAGAVHLVVTGDLLDRGPDSRRVMDLLRSLETAAAEQGGTVHLLLGNHEVMNLVGRPALRGRRRIRRVRGGRIGCGARALVRTLLSDGGRGCRSGCGPAGLGRTAPTGLSSPTAARSVVTVSTVHGYCRSR